MAAEGYLNSLSSIISFGQIFGIMPVERYRRCRQHHRHRRTGGINHQTTNQIFVSMDDDKSLGSTGAAGGDTTTIVPSSATILNLHDSHLFAKDNDSNAIVNKVVDTRDYGKKDALRHSSSSYGEKDDDKGSHCQDQKKRNRGTLYHYLTQFNWKHPRTVYSVLLIALGSAEWMCTIHEVAKFGVSVGSIGAFNFYTIANFGLIMFFCLGRKWPSLYEYWTDVAQVFDGLPYRQQRRNSKMSSGVKIRAVFRIWMSIALVETIIYRLVSVMDIAKQKHVCHLSESLAEILYSSWRPHIYHIIDFESWHLPFLEILNISLTVTWTYLDVFLMMISLGIQGLYETFNVRMDGTSDKKMPYSFWIEMRTHYVVLNNLVEFVDEHLAILIVISFASNLYFICLQLFNSFINTYKSWIHIIYFYYSMMMVIVRAIAVLKCASGIEVSAKKSQKVLRQIPTERWNDELQRLSDMMSHDLVALSGCRFFHLTKSLFLAMAGTVATYELVILDMVELQTSDDEVSGVICSNPA